MSERAAERANVLSRRYCQVATVVCVALGLASLAVFTASLFQPTGENRVDLFLRAYGWLYVGALHALIAELLTSPGATS